MAEIGKKVFKEKYSDKIQTINEFREAKGGISAQAVDYAIKNDRIDYVNIGKRVRVIVLTEKSLAYTPNLSLKREKKI